VFDDGTLVQPLRHGYEVLRVDLWERAFDMPRTLRAIRWRLIDPEAILMLYALSAQVEEDV
jgi:hypothetical protein